MKLAKLAYEIAKDAIKFSSGFNFEGFVAGDYDETRDFSSQISFAFSYINLAIARLITTEKTLLKVQKVSTNEIGYADFNLGEITSVVDSISPKYQRVFFRRFGNGIAVESNFVSKDVYIEYRPFVPLFGLSSIREQVLDDDNHETYQEVEIELQDYGITDEMCSYIKEYAIGGLTEYLSPELSNRHTQMAEAYFASLKTRYTDFPQREVIDNVKGGGAF